jgi:hypothetical protein
MPAKQDPTLLAGVGESDRRLTRGPAARGPPLPQNDARSTPLRWTRDREGVRVQGTRATVGCARRIPTQHRGPDKFSNLSHEAAAPPRRRRTAQRQLAGGNVQLQTDTPSARTTPAAHVP